jgi:hypothetical protein
MHCVTIAAYHVHFFQKGCKDAHFMHVRRIRALTTRQLRTSYLLLKCVSRLLKYLGVVRMFQDECLARSPTPCSRRLVSRAALRAFHVLLHRVPLL